MRGEIVSIIIIIIILIIIIIIIIINENGAEYQAVLK